METKNLMIDDMVQEWNNDHTESHIVKVEKPMRDGGVYDKFNHFHEADWIEPIPLTAKILKKNGFTDVGDCIYQNEEQCCGVELNTFMFYVYANDYDNDNCHDVANVFNVHQLQHALRLVGLTEMADNLKV